jgi:hypothetical protein
MHLVFYYYVSGTRQDIFTLNEYGGWAVELLGLYLLGAVALFLREQVNLQFLQVILGIKYSFRNLNAL